MKSIKSDLSKNEKRLNLDENHLDEFYKSLFDKDSHKLTKLGVLFVLGYSLSVLSYVLRCEVKYGKSKI